MNFVRWALTLVLGVGLTTAGFAFKEPEPDDPHLGLLAEQNCTACHDVDDLKTLLGDEFVGAILDPCYQCHLDEELGRSHPVNVNLERNRRLPDLEVPDELLVGGQWDDLLTCATCHFVHGDWKSNKKAYNDQAPLPDRSFGSSHFYSTYYLRVPGDPETGWMPLCLKCHTDY